MIKNNSKQIKKKDIFICTHDEYEDRHKYIDSIKEASAIIVDKDIKRTTKIPIIKVNSTNDTYYQIYNDYYNHPTKDLNIIGITGTDGKTTTAYIIKEILNNIKNTAYLGTLGLLYKDKKIDTPNTTVAIDKFLEYASILKEENINNLVMEVSSEGLLHNRCNNIKFKRTIITNVTGDHLNIHKTFDNYLKSKLKLFNLLEKDGIAIINIDDISYKYIKKKKDKNNKIKILTYGFNKKADYKIINYKLTNQKTYFSIKYKNKTYQIESPLLGKFNIYNLTAAIATINSLGINIEKIIELIKKITPIPGRLNVFKTKNNSNLILDYAHTINATKSILEFANSTKQGNIITVVGCAGGREKEKRKNIGKIVTDYSTKVIFTMDDPRYEKVKDIVNQMLQEVNKDNFIYIKNRKKAIKKAINISKENDTILILGKGTDNYMAIKNKYKKYNDLNIIKKYTKN